jgi:preprotein translocase subunit SecD
MDKGFFARLTFMLGLIVWAWLVLWPSVNDWVPAPEPVKKMFTSRISPGLDIRGGLRLMYEVEVEEAVRDRRDLRADQLVREMGVRLGTIPKDEMPSREAIEKTKERVKAVLEGDRDLRIEFKEGGDLAKLDRELVELYGDLRETNRTSNAVSFEIRTDFLEQIRTTAVQQARETIGNRIDGLGLREASVTVQNTDIVVEVPGADESTFDRIRDIIGKTARLEFQIVDDEASFVADLTDLPEGIEKKVEVASAGPSKPQVATSFLVARGKDGRQKLTDYMDALKTEGKIPEDHELLIGPYARAEDDEPDKAKQGEEAYRTYFLFGRAEVTGQAIEDAFVSNDPQTNKPYVAVNFNHDGAETFRQLTGRNVKRRMAIVLDDKVESAPVIQQEIGGGRCQITLGGFRPYNEVLNEANDLVIVLKAGALPVPIRPANEQMIGPTLGRDGVEQGAKGAAAGILLVLIFMLIYYQVGGLVADVMMVLNVLFMLAALAFFEATLTLPGLAAIALNVGMAVDANVLINERIREELRAGKSTRAAVDQGFDRAFWSIFDGQITTLLAAIVLFQYGTGPIKGFSVTLMIGILTSLFTGVFCSRVAFDWLVRGLGVQRLRVG